MIKYIVFLLFAFKLTAAHEPSRNEVLEVFVNYIIHHSTLGYSLCGEKPVAMECLPSLSRSPPHIMAKIFFEMPGYHILWHGVEQWQKSSLNNLSNNYTMKFQNGALVLINKKETLRAIDENIDLFHSLLKTSKTAQELVDDLGAQKDPRMLTNPVLAGILFGYGRENALAFSHRILRKMKNHNELKDQRLCTFLNPGFFILDDGTNTSENQRVIKSFKNAKKELVKNFSGRNYIETFIKLYQR